jgi:hypothetical protein
MAAAFLASKMISMFGKTHCRLPRLSCLVRAAVAFVWTCKAGRNFGARTRLKGWT